MKTLITTLLLVLFVQLQPVMAQDTAAFHPAGKFSGYMFGDYFYNIQQRDTSKNDLNGFQFRRIYFTYDYAIAKNFDSRFRLEADQAALTSNGKIGVFVKDAYLKWKEVFEGSDLVFGMSPTPTYDASEEAWGYRSLEKVIMDLRGIVPSRDLGADLKGKITGGGELNYWLKIGNNSGNTPEADRFKRYYGQIQVKPVSNFQLIASGDYDAEAKVTDIADGLSKDNGRITLSGFAGYKEANSYSLGVEGFYRIMQNGYRSPLTSLLGELKTSGLTAFAWGAIADNVRLVGRFDLYDPNTSVEKDGSYLVIGALDYMPAPDVHIMPNLYFQQYEADVASDVIARLTFHYIFK